MDPRTAELSSGTSSNWKLLSYGREGQAHNRQHNGQLVCLYGCPAKAAVRTEAMAETQIYVY